MSDGVGITEVLLRKRAALTFADLPMGKLEHTKANLASDNRFTVAKRIVGKKKKGKEKPSPQPPPAASHRSTDLVVFFYWEILSLCSKKKIVPTSMFGPVLFITFAAPLVMDGS